MNGLPILARPDIADRIERLTGISWLAVRPIRDQSVLLMIRSLAQTTIELAYLDYANGVISSSAYNQLERDHSIVCSWIALILAWDRGEITTQDLRNCNALP